jgi:hypothetical protein
LSAPLDGFTFDDTLLQSTKEPRTGDLVIVRVGDFCPHSVQLSAREYGGALLTAKVMARSTSGATVGVVLQVWGYDQPVVLPLYHARVVTSLLVFAGHFSDCAVGPRRSRLGSGFSWPLGAWATALGGIPTSTGNIGREHCCFVRSFGSLLTARGSACQTPTSGAITSQCSPRFCSRQRAAFAQSRESSNHASFNF